MDEQNKNNKLLWIEFQFREIGVSISDMTWDDMRVRDLRGGWGWEGESIFGSPCCGSFGEVDRVGVGVEKHRFWYLPLTTPWLLRLESWSLILTWWHSLSLFLSPSSPLSVKRCWLSPIIYELWLGSLLAKSLTFSSRTHALRTPHPHSSLKINNMRTYPIGG
jgi:hypothetical protein